jgi:alanine dehydrogenase
MSAPALLLSRRDITAMMRPRDYLNAAEAAFRAEAEGRAQTAAPMHVETSNGVFHAKGGWFRDQRGYVALKFNANFPGNPTRFGLPTIQGAILLCDADNGALLAILDSVEITARRTAAASALAARCLASANARRLLLCGCGVQGRAHAQALADVFKFELIFCWDQDAAKANALAHSVAATLEVDASPTPNLEQAAGQSDIIVTCTSSTRPFLTLAHVRPGAFIAAVGADNPSKSELAPALLARAALICDSAAQCGEMGELHHALAAGVVTPNDVRAELSEIVSGAKAGRRNAEEIVVFDSIGVAVQDAAACALAYQRAIETDRGTRWALHDA